MNELHGIIFAYEQRENLRELTRHRAPASLPFGGRYRVVDFALSNLVNAGVTDVGVVLNGRYQSLLDHLGTGKNWDLSRKRGGMKLLPPFSTMEKWGDTAFRGKMEVLAGVRSYLEEIRQDYVVLMDGDLVVNLPLEQVLAAHIASGADITAVCANNCDEVDNATYFQLDGTGRITDTFYRVNQPRGQRSLEVYILTKSLLLNLVDDCVSHDQYSFRRDVLQAKSDKLRLQSFVWNGYAAQMRSVREYYDRSMELLNPQTCHELFWRTIRAKSSDVASTYLAPESHCVNSLIADGCCIDGRVEHSILFPGVVVEKGAELRDCVLFKGTVVRSGAILRNVITDKYVEVLPARTLQGHDRYPLVVEKGAII